MPSYTVQQGDWIGSIAKQFGIFDWHKIYDDPQNADLRKNRPDPQLLFPGDVVFVPDMVPAEFSRPTDGHHKFLLKKPTTKLVIIVKDEDDQPIASKPYTLKLDKTYNGTTDGQGKLQEDIPMDAQDGTLEVDGYQYQIHVGHLDPLEEVTGIQKRLTNIGYDCSPIDGTMNDNTVAAITRFQQEMNLDATGHLDDSTKNKLKEKYGC